MFLGDSPLILRILRLLKHFAIGLSSIAAGYFFLTLARPNTAEATLNPNLAPFGSNSAMVKKTLAGKCESLYVHRVTKFLDVAEKSQIELRCEKFDYFGKNRTLTLVFSDDQLDIVRIGNIRNLLPSIKKTLDHDYGEASISSQWVDYYATAGIALLVTPNEISFVSHRSQNGYEKYINTIKDHPLNLSLTRLQWEQDLYTLDNDIRNFHINPFWHKDEAGYTELFYEAQHYISNSEKIDSVIVNGYFEKLVAYISDGHSYIVNKAARFGEFPYRLEWFADGLFIVSIAESNKHLLGAKIIAFDNIDIDQANSLITPFIPTVNSSSFKLQSHDAYQFGGLLQAASISKLADSVVLTLELENGERVKQLFNVSEKNQNIKYSNIHENKDVETPLHRQTKEKNQWFSFIEKEHALYIGYTAVVESKKGDIEELTKQMNQFLDSHEVKKLIVDVRDNSGGDSYLNAPLINAIVKNKNLNERGKLFVLTNHNTFSAAINFVGNMEVKTRALFVGEKVGDSATFAGESGPQAKFSLPNSNIAVSLSFSEWNSTYDNDKRDAPGLDIPVELTMQDVLFGRDPVLQAALDYKAEPTQLKKNSETEQSSWIGRYDYSPDKALNIFVQNDELQMEITELAFSKLYLLSENEAKTDMIGIQLKKLKNGDIEIIQQGSENRLLPRLSSNQLKPLELLIAGRLYEAKAAYRSIYDSYPNLLSIRGNSLGVLATYLRARHGKQELYDQLREVAVSLYGSPIASWDE